MKIRNKLLISSFLFLGIQNYAQQVNAVGIETNSPKETLHVNGTTRVREMPITGGHTKTVTTFTPTRNIVADADGNIGYTTPKEWQLFDSNVVARYTTSGLYQRSEFAHQLYRNTENEADFFPTNSILKPLEDSIIDIEVPENFPGKSKIIIDYLTSFKLTNSNGEVQKDLHFGDTNFAFQLTLRIYKVDGSNKSYKWREVPISREYLYQNNVGGYYSQTMKAQYSHEAEPGAHYRYELMIGGSFQGWRYEQMDGKRLANTRLLGQARLFLENK